MSLSLRINEIADSVRALLESVEVETFAGPDALAVMRAFSALDNVASAGKTVFAGRAASCNAASNSGARGAAEFLAAQTGDSPAEMALRLATARRLESLPDTRSAFVSGKLSPTQTAAVSRGAVDAQCESELLALAQSKSVRELQDQSRRIANGASSADEQARRRELARKRRSARLFIDPEDASMFKGFIRGPVEDLAAIKANVLSRQDRVFRAAREAKNYESPDSYAYDATLELLTGDPDDSSSKSSKVRHQVLIHTDHDTFTSGATSKNSRCETQDGVPIPLSKLYEIIENENPIVRLLVEKGEDISYMAKVDGRQITAATMAVALARDPVCVNPLCRGVNPQLDHRRPVKDGGPPTLSNLMGLCPQCHYLKTHHGWAMVGPRGDWMFVKRRASGDGGIGYPLDRDEDPAQYLAATKAAQESYPGEGQLGPFEGEGAKPWEELKLPWDSAS